jgi:Photosynthetic reaction centre cytochrome C subunit
MHKQFFWRAVILIALVSAVSLTMNSRAQTSGEPQAAFDQKQKLAELNKALAGRENEPAEKVFKNIQLLKGMPASRLLRVMENGYGKSLGVDCTHCHVADAWEKEDKPAKQITREMAAMTQAINGAHLKAIKNLKSATPVVNCTTCHRGQVKPATNLP